MNKSNIYCREAHAMLRGTKGMPQNEVNLNISSFVELKESKSADKYLSTTPIISAVD